MATLVAAAGRRGVEGCRSGDDGRGTAGGTARQEQEEADDPAPGFHKRVGGQLEVWGWQTCSRSGTRMRLRQQTLSITGDALAESWWEGAVGHPQRPATWLAGRARRYR